MKAAGDYGSELLYFDANKTTGQLTLTFSRALTVAEKGGLDVVVSAFLDKASLTAFDAAASKYIRLMKSANQLLPTTVGTTSEVILDAVTYVDNDYFQMSLNRNLVSITKPGTYLLAAKVGACFGGAFVSNTVLNWSIGFDDTRQGSIYVNLAGTSVYTSHINDGAGYDSTNLICVLVVNSLTGTNVRLQCKLQSGLTKMSIDAAATSMSILNLPYASLYEANTTANVTLSSANASNLALGAPRLQHVPFSSSAGQTQVTVALPGHVMYFAKATFNKTSGLDASIGMLKVTLNGVPIETAVSFTHAITAANLKTTVHFLGMAMVEPGDKLGLQAQTASGTALQVTSAETGLVALFFEPANMPLSTIANITNSTINPNTNSDAIKDLYLGRISYSVPTQNVTSTDPYNRYINIQDAGVYLIMGTLSILNQSGFARTQTIWLMISIDEGVNYYPVPMSAAYKNVPNAQRTSISLTCLVHLPPTSTLKIQGFTNGTLLDLTQVAEHCQLNLFNMLDLARPASEVSQVNRMFESREPLLVNSTSSMEKCRIVTKYLVPGMYRLNTAYSLLLPSGASASNVSIMLWVYNCIYNSTKVVFSKVFNLKNAFQQICSFDRILIEEGINVLFFHVASTDGTNTMVTDLTLEMSKEDPVACSDH